MVEAIQVRLTGLSIWRKVAIAAVLGWMLLLAASSLTYQGARVYCAVSPCHTVYGRCYVMERDLGGFCGAITGPSSFPLR